MYVSSLIQETIELDETRPGCDEHYIQQMFVHVPHGNTLNFQYNLCTISQFLCKSISPFCLS